MHIFTIPYIVCQCLTNKHTAIGIVKHDLTILELLDLLTQNLLTSNKLIERLYLHNMRWFLWFTSFFILYLSPVSGVPTSVTLSPKSRSIRISWSKPVESQSTIQGYRVRVLLNSECVVEVLLVCSTGCTNKVSILLVKISLSANHIYTKATITINTFDSRNFSLFRILQS